jgi:hypothetical protein
MMISTKVAIFSAAAGLVIGLTVKLIGPGEAEFYALSPELADALGFLINIAAALATSLLLVALVSIIITAYNKIKGEDTRHSVKVKAHKITAENAAIIATDNIKQPQPTSISDQTITFNLSNQHMEAVKQLLEHVKASELPEDDKMHAQRLVDALERERQTERPDNTKLKAIIKDIVEIAESTKLAVETVILSIRSLKSII